MAHRPTRRRAVRVRLHDMKEVTCLCGWQCRGTDDEVVEQVQAHGVEAHGVAATREEILAIAVAIPQ